MLSKQNLFRIKFTIALFAVALVSLVGYGFYRAEEQVIMGSLARDTEVLSEAIEQAFRHHMLEGAREQTQRLIDTISQLSAIGRVRIYDREGTVRFSSLREEVGRVERKSDPTCRLCHEGVAVDQNVTVRFEEAGLNYFRSVNPIRREAECGRCHRGETKTLGVLMIDLSIDEALEVLDDFRRATILLVLSITVVFGILVFLNQVFDWFRVGP